MAVYVHPLKRKERQQLEALLAQQNPDVPALRVQIVLMSDEGKSVQQISQAVGLHPINVRKWIHRFAQHGLAGLSNSKRSGRPRVFTPEQRQRILKLFRTHPHRLGLSFAYWTLPRLQQYVIEQGVVPHISIETLRQMLHTATSTRTKYNPPHDDAYPSHPPQTKLGTG
jgi:transposase